jgi:hypothetical protein
MMLRMYILPLGGLEPIKVRGYPLKTRLKERTLIFIKELFNKRI